MHRLPLLTSRLHSARFAVHSGTRLIIAIIFTLALGCSAAGTPPESTHEPVRTLCVDPRPQACTREYRPVCGRLGDGSTNTFGNACDACGRQTVVSHRPGEC